MAVSHEAKKQHVRASSGLHDHYSELFTQIKVENESDDRDNLGHLDHFFGGQVDLIRKLNYLDVTGYHMFFRKQCCHLISE